MTLTYKMATNKSDS